eukprot:tig00000655_g2859.t1
MQTLIMMCSQTLAVGRMEQLSIGSTSDRAKALLEEVRDELAKILPAERAAFDRELRDLVDHHWTHASLRAEAVGAPAEAIEALRSANLSVSAGLSELVRHRLDLISCAVDKSLSKAIASFAAEFRGAEAHTHAAAAGSAWGRPRAPSAGSLGTSGAAPALRAAAPAFVPAGPPGGFGVEVGREIPPPAEPVDPNLGLGATRE